MRRVARSWADETRGQVAVIVALSFVVLLGAVALATEWGFSLTQRRVAQNAADGSALAGARLLAGSVIATGSGNIYQVLERQDFCRANDVARQNLGALRPSSPRDTLLLEWAASDPSGRPAAPWRTVQSPVGTAPRYGCPGPGTVVTGGPLVDPSAAFIRATVTIEYSSALGRIAGQSTITASARAVARIVGTPLPLTGPSWPLVRHFNSSDFAGGPCSAPPCDPFTFWSSGNSPDITFNSFMGLVDFSRWSPNANLANGKPPCPTTMGGAASAACVPQLIDDWDRSGVSPNGKPDLNPTFASGTPCSPPAPSSRWYTTGLEDPQNADKQCSLLNWIAYGFTGPAGPGETGPRGSLSLTSDYQGIGYDGTTEFRERPSAVTNAARRSVCGSVPSALPSPSCANPRIGDWVEAAQTGNVGSNIAAALRYFVSQHGETDSNSGLRTGPGGGAPVFGKKAVILIYLWDCAEAFDDGAPGGHQWTLLMPTGSTSDCSDVHDGGDIGSEKIGRVHLFSAAPFTFYEGLVETSRIRGYWGGAVSGSAGVCASTPTAPGCAINPFSNAVFLVADD